MKIESNVFLEGAMIPPKYTCDGQNVSPPLTWHDAPAGTKSFALINDDPDAPSGTWVHWLIWNIPANQNSLPEAVQPEKECPDGAKQGVNSFPKVGYGGPCPPSGVHRYYFKLYALDFALALKPTATKENLLHAMEGHILAEAQLMGRYKRQK
jgi:Raf kinase inhibitor-like YbhB/YbcL family protein